MATYLKIIGIPVALVVAALLSYFTGALYSRQKIDRFCDSIGPATTFQELPQLAKQADVEWHHPIRLDDKNGEFLYALVPDMFTVGEYACRVRGDVSSGLVTSKRSGY